MRQYAWLELYEGVWHLITDVRDEPVRASRKWIDKDTAVAELLEEGWIVSGTYPNWLSDKIGLGSKYRGYGLKRVVH